MREMNDKSLMSTNNPHLAAALSAGNSQQPNPQQQQQQPGDMWGGGPQQQSNVQVNNPMSMLQNQLATNNQQANASMLQNQLNQPLQPGMTRGPMPQQMRMQQGQFSNMNQVSLNFLKL
jgi:hypothetical protein